MPAPDEKLHLPDLLKRREDLSASLASRLKQRAQAAMWGTAHPSGIWRNTTHACHRRPNRKACKGTIVVRRQDVPPAIDWACSECGSTGVISGWQGTEFHLEEDSVTEEDASFGHEVSLSAYRLLCDLAYDWPELRRLAFGAFVKVASPDRAASAETQYDQITVGSLGSDRAAIAERLIDALADETRPKRHRLLQELVLLAIEPEGAESEDQLV